MTQASDAQNHFQVVNSNDLEVLSSVCARIIQDHPLSDPLKKDLVLVMNSGMQTYLNQEIAVKNGIASGIEYSQVWAFIWDIYKQIFKDENEGEQSTLNCFSRDSIAWSLLGMKSRWSDPKSPLKDIFAPLREYVADDDESGLRTWKLCYRVADTLDQYQMNRPGWIRAFNALTDEDFLQYADNPNLHGKVFECLRMMSPKRLKSPEDGIAPQVRQNVWQLKLWSMLRENLKGFSPQNRGHFKFLDRVQIVDHLCEALNEDGRELSAILPERVFIMGVSSLPEQVLDLLSALGRHAQVYLMLVNPCREYWGDLSVGRHSLRSVQEILKPRSRRFDDSSLSGVLDLNLENEAPASRYNADGELEGGNALLTGLGRQGRDILSLLLDRPAVPDFINCFVRPERDCVLNALKDNLLTLDRSSVYEISPDDDSLVFCSCHTRRREVEVLRDSILQKFHEAQERGETLLPRDILVMTPNIEQYAPHIEAVFGAADPASPTFIPYAVGDRSVGRENPASAAMLRLMDIGKTPVTLSFVIELLQVPEIGAVFNIAPDEVEILQDWCERARVHWGLDADETTAEAGVADLPWTFERGISRLIESYMLGGDVAGGLDLIEGTDVDLLGRFCAFIRALIALRGFFKKYEREDLHLETGRGTDGTSVLETIRRDFFERFLGSVEQSPQALEFSRTLYGMCKILPELKELPEITLPVLRAMLSESLSNKIDEAAYLRGSVNFCSLMPMRAVPFRHIFILGLNELDFPRRERAPGFNLLTLPAFFRRGDRSRSVDDRYLFLEAILSAKDSLTLSYLGQSPVEGTQSNPSAVVSELYDYLSDNFRLAGTDDEDASGRDLIRDRLTYRASLNSYDPRNFIRQNAEIGQGAGVRRLPSFDEGSFIKEFGTLEHRRRAPLGACDDFGVSLPPRITLSLSQLLGFFSSPCRSFLRSRGIMFEEFDSTDDDRESFALDHLEAALIKLECSALDSDEDLSLALERRAKEGVLPYGIFREKSCEDIREFRSGVRENLEQAIRAEGLDPQILRESVRLPFDSGFVRASELFSPSELAAFHIDGDLEISLKDEATFPAVQLDPYSGGFTRPKAALAVALEALAQSLCTAARRPRMISLWCVRDAVLRYTPLDPARAREFLNALMRWYLIGMVRPLPLWSELMKGAVKAPEVKKGVVVEYEFKSAEFGYDSEARYLFEDPAVLSEDSAVYDGDLAALAEDFMREVVIPYVRDPLHDYAGEEQ